MSRWRKIENGWKTNRSLAVCLGIGGAAAAVWAICTVPIPGIAIGLLATVAGIMSVRPPEMHIVERLSWIAILVVLLCAEVRSIVKNDHDNTAKTQSILDGMTGGDSYLNFVPYPQSSAQPDEDKFIFQMFVNGKNTVWDARLDVDERQNVTAGNYFDDYNPRKVQIGSVSSTYGSGLDGFVEHPSRDKENSYTFRVYSRNLPTTEVIRMRFNLNAKEWEFAATIWRSLPPDWRRDLTSTRLAASHLTTHGCAIITTYTAVSFLYSNKPTNSSIDHT